MSQSLRWAAMVLLGGGLLASPAWAAGAGDADLDAAMAAKLDADSLADYGKVIQLAESALEKGVDEDNKAFAEQLVASTRAQRGLVIANMIFTINPPDRRWPSFRQAALEDLDKAVQLDENQPEAWLMVARLNLLPGGDAKRAVVAVDKAVEKSEDAPQIRANALVIRAGMSDDAEKQRADLDAALQAMPHSAPALRARALLQAQKEKYDAALADFDKALELEPDHAPTHEARALVLSRLGKYDEAITALDRARDLEPDAAEPLVQKAQVYAAQERFDAALNELDQALALDPDNAAALLLRSGIHQEQGQKEKALADVDKVLKLRPGLPAAVRIRALLLAGEGKLETAIQELEKLRESDPKDIVSQLQLAMFYSSHEDYQKALDLFNAILQAEPDNWLALRGRADTYLQFGRHAEAIADYERVLTLQPEDTSVLNNLAWVLATSPKDEVRDGKRAIELATKAVKLTEEKAAHILSTLAAGYAETGDFETALTWSRKALEMAEEEELREPLQKELQSYEQKKPWRELLSAEKKEKEEDKTETPPAADAAPPK